MTEFHYHGNEHSYRPVVTWVERITPKYVRACAAAVPGKLNVLAGGRIKWLALYNYTQSAVEKSGIIQTGQLTNVKSYTADKHCFSVAFPSVSYVLFAFYWSRLLKVLLSNGVTRSLKRLICLLYTSPSPRDQRGSRMPSSA